MREQHKKLPDNPTAFLLRNRLIKVTPGNQGKDCLAFKPGDKCACDECQHYRTCWPDVDPSTGKPHDEA